MMGLLLLIVIIMIYYHFNMEVAIEVLEKKIKELQAGRVLTRKLLRRKTKRGFSWLVSKLKNWDKRDKGRILKLKKAIKFLSNPSNLRKS